MLSFTQVIGSTLDVAGVGLNRTGTDRRSGQEFVVVERMARSTSTTIGLRDIGVGDPPAGERDMTSIASQASATTAPASAGALSPAIARALLALVIVASFAAGLLATGTEASPTPSQDRASRRGHCRHAQRRTHVGDKSSAHLLLSTG